MTERAPTLANSFDMQIMPGIVALRFVHALPGQDFSSAFVVAWPAMDPQLARNVAEMILEQTDPKRLADMQIAAMRARVAAESPHPANDEPPPSAA